MSDPLAFNTGLPLASDLRLRLLRDLGVEEEWTERGPGGVGYLWRHGELGTLFELLPVPGGASSVAVLRVTTPVATVGDPTQAAALCERLNGECILNRWISGPWPATAERVPLRGDEDDDSEDNEDEGAGATARQPEDDGDGEQGEDGPPGAEVLYLSCTIVVGRLDLGRGDGDDETVPSAKALPELARITVADQIATAVAVLRAGVHDEVAGVPFVARDANGQARPQRHRVTQFHDALFDAPDDEPSLLWRALLTAFDELRWDQEADGGPVWGGGDGRGFRCELPFGWGPYPRPDDRPVEVVMNTDGLIGPDNAASLLLASRTQPHPEAGGGVLLTMRVPLRLRGNDDVSTVLATLNCLDVTDPGAGHGIGSWVLRGDHPTWRLFLPNAVASIGPAMTIAVLREVLLAAAAASLLARRVLLHNDELNGFDRRPIGAASRHPMGLAYGAEARLSDEPAHILDVLYSSLVGPDTEWAQTTALGFDWWPHRGRQRVRVTPRPRPDDGRRAGLLRISTEVATGVRANSAVLRAIARRNAENGRSALVLDPRGETLEIVARLQIGPGTNHADRAWSRLLAIEQMIEAEAAAAEITGQLSSPWRRGAPAASEHPTSGARPTRDILFRARHDIRQAAQAAFAAAATHGARVHPLVLPLALTGLLAPPHRVTSHEPGQSLTAEWWTRTYDPSGQAARCQLEFLVLDDPDIGPGVRVRTRLDAFSGNVDQRAAWCNSVNHALLSENVSDDLTVVGGWGLDATDTPCLTTWLFPETLAGDHPDELAAALSDLARNQQWLVFVSIAESGIELTSDGLSEIELAAGLPSLYGTFRAVLDMPEGQTLTARRRCDLAHRDGDANDPDVEGPGHTDPHDGLDARENPDEEPGGDPTVIVELSRLITPPVHEELITWSRLAQPVSAPGRSFLVTRLEAPLEGLRGPLALLLATIASASRTWVRDIRPQPTGALGPLTVPGHLSHDFRESHVRDAVARLLFDGDVIEDAEGFLVLARRPEPADLARACGGAPAADDDSAADTDTADSEVSRALADELGLGAARHETIARLATPYPIDHPFYGGGVMVLDTHLHGALTRGLALTEQSGALRIPSPAAEPSAPRRPRRPDAPADSFELAAALTALNGLDTLPTCGAWVADETAGTLVYRICLPPSCLLWPIPEAVGTVVHAAWRVAIRQARAAAALVAQQVPETVT